MNYKGFVGTVFIAVILRDLLLAQPQMKTCVGVPVKACKKNLTARWKNLQQNTQIRHNIKTIDCHLYSSVF